MSDQFSPKGIFIAGVVIALFIAFVVIGGFVEGLISYSEIRR